MFRKNSWAESKIDSYVAAMASMPGFAEVRLILWKGCISLCVKSVEPERLLKVKNSQSKSLYGIKSLLHPWVLCNPSYPQGLKPHHVS